MAKYASRLHLIFVSKLRKAIRYTSRPGLLRVQNKDGGRTLADDVEVNGRSWSANQRCVLVNLTWEIRGQRAWREWQDRGMPLLCSSFLILAFCFHGFTLSYTSFPETSAYLRGSTMELRGCHQCCSAGFHEIRTVT